MTDTVTLTIRRDTAEFLFRLADSNILESDAVLDELDELDEESDSSYHTEHTDAESYSWDVYNALRGEGFYA